MYHHEVESTSTTTCGSNNSNELEAFTSPKTFESFNARLHQQIESIRKYQLNTDLSAKEKVKQNIFFSFYFMPIYYFI